MGMERLGVQFRNESGVESSTVGSGRPGPDLYAVASSAAPLTRTTLSDGLNDYRILQPHDPENESLLTVLRDDVLCKKIPAHDVDGVDLLRARLNGEEEGIALVAIVAGQNLTDTFNRVAKGGCLAELYTHPHTNEAHAHLTYLVALNEGEGIGKFLIQSRIALLEEMARAKNVPLRTIFIEVCDNNEANKQKFLKLGARPGPGGYCRPDVQDNTLIVDDYADMYYPVGGRYPDAQAIEEARACYWRAQGIADPHAHPEFQEMVARAHEWPGFSQSENPAFEASLQAFRVRHGFAAAESAPAAPRQEDDSQAVRRKPATASGWLACRSG